MTASSVFIAGNFGGLSGQIDGQTVKTCVIRDAFAVALGRSQVRELDSSRLLSTPLHFLRSARSGIRCSCQSIMLPGCRGLQLFLPLFLHWKTKFKKPLQYVVVGGWLPQLLAAKPWLRRLCMRLDGIYVETAAMSEALNRLGLTNVEVMPNFRNFDRHVNREFGTVNRPIKLVFYSRVMREKGVEESIAAVAKLCEWSTDKPPVTLHIYGPVVRGYEKNFSSAIRTVFYARYCGVLRPEQAPHTLQGYDLMLFPTYYEGEGFPGAILDSFIAGVPVIASDWKYNREIITEGKTGAFCKVRSVEDLAARVQAFIDDPEQIAPMRRHCVEQSQRYHVDIAVQQLLRPWGKLRAQTDRAPQIVN